jgi:Carboxypeptidase regulatory-like domain
MSREILRGRNVYQCGRINCTVISLVLFVLLALSIVPRAAAQRLDGTLRVVVSDVSGASVTDAKVTVTNEGTNVSQSTNASSNGAYEFPHLLIGSYTVTVEKEGFRKYIGKGVRVAASQVADATVKLELGEANLVVEVNSAGDLIQTTSSELGSSMGVFFVMTVAGRQFCLRVVK